MLIFQRIILYTNTDVNPKFTRSKFYKDYGLMSVITQHSSPVTLIGVFVSAWFESENTKMLIYGHWAFWQKNISNKYHSYFKSNSQTSVQVSLQPLFVCLFVANVGYLGPQVANASMHVFCIPQPLLDFCMLTQVKNLPNKNIVRVWENYSTFQMDRDGFFQ